MFGDIMSDSQLMAGCDVKRHDHMVRDVRNYCNDFVSEIGSELSRFPMFITTLIMLDKNLFWISERFRNHHNRGALKLEETSKSHCRCIQTWIHLPMCKIYTDRQNLDQVSLECGAPVQLHSNTTIRQITAQLWALLQCSWLFPFWYKEQTRGRMGRKVPSSFASGYLKLLQWLHFRAQLKVDLCSHVYSSFLFWYQEPRTDSWLSRLKKHTNLVRDIRKILRWLHYTHYRALPKLGGGSDVRSRFLSWYQNQK